MKVVCIHPRFAGLTSHHYNESHAFMRELHRRGAEFVLLMNLGASAELAAEFDARAVLDDPTFRMEWDFEERSDRFLAMIRRHVQPLAESDDRVLITVSTQLEAHALTRWLGELPAAKRPWIVVLILSDRWNRSGPEEYQRQVAEFGKLRAAIAALPPHASRRLLFFTLTALLADELMQLLSAEVRVAPVPLAYGDPRDYPAPPRQTSRPRVVVLGGTRREKGSHLLPAIIRACAARVEVEFFVHVANNTLGSDEVQALAQIADEPHVVVVREPMSLHDYNVALVSADLALFPYEVLPYRKRNSGVFAEAVAYGKPVIATAGTWMAEQIEAGRAAGRTFEPLTAEAVADAVARSVADLDALRQRAAALSGPWRQDSGVAGFVDLMEAGIAERGKHPPCSAPR